MESNSIQSPALDRLKSGCRLRTRGGTPDSGYRKAYHGRTHTDDHRTKDRTSKCAALHGDPSAGYNARIGKSATATLGRSVWLVGEQRLKAHRRAVVALSRHRYGGGRG